MRDNNGAKPLQKEAAKRNEKLSGGAPWRTLDLCLTILAVLVFATVLRGAVLEPVRVEGSSMLETLQPSDYMFVEKVSYAFEKPKVGDIVICYYPDAYYEQSGKAYRSRVKRVVAVAGDTVQSIDGVLLINGIPLDEPYLSDAHSYTAGIETPIVVAEGEVFVLGDNRINSNDSRNALVGAIPLNRIVGKAHFVLFPFSHLHGV